MKRIFALFLFSCFLLFFAQNPKQENVKYEKTKISPYVVEAQEFQKKLNSEYLNPDETPLRRDNFKNFKRHPFFSIDINYRVKAQLVRTNNAKPFEIPTSSGATQTYREYGKIYFKLEDKHQVLTIYQNLRLIQMEEYKNHLFLPFRDETNGKETYGGGKYIDLEIPKSNTIIVDFNKSYQPYCAYNAYDYSCPIVPEENKLSISIKAGVMYEDIYHH